MLIEKSVKLPVKARVNLEFYETLQNLEVGDRVKTETRNKTVSFINYLDRRGIKSAQRRENGCYWVYILAKPEGVTYGA